jgi:hypothetical protein
MPRILVEHQTAVAQKVLEGARIVGVARAALSPLALRMCHGEMARRENRQDQTRLFSFLWLYEFILRFFTT